MKICIKEALESYLSKTNLASKASNPISLLNSFKMSLFDEAKKKADSDDRKDLIKGYDQNDCKSLCALVEYFEGIKLRDFGLELCADNKLLKPRIKALQEAEQLLASTKGEVDKTLSIWRKEPIKITVDIETTHIFEGSLSIK